MSKIQRQSNNFLNETSWINDVTNNTRLAKTLNDEYANDVLEAVADDTFSSIDAAIADLKTRIGLTASESNEIKMTCVAMVKNTTAPVEKVSAEKIEKESWFQGSTEVPKEDKEKVVSNDPNALGYKAEITYDKKSMETTAPGGQDSRPAEQKAFEEAAKETKKDLGPSGKELTLKEKLQRARLAIQGLKVK